MAIQLIHFSDCGSVREVNQDAYCVRLCSMGDKLLAMLVICDGMGGMSCGEVASSLVVSTFETWFDKRLEYWQRVSWEEKDILDEWNQLVMEGHHKLKRFAERNGAHLGTTLSTIFLNNDRYCLMHVGDCRIYLEDSGGIGQLTKDQTLAMRELESGRITRQEFNTDKRRNVLLQCIGDRSVSPEVQIGRIPERGALLLASDGFYHTVTGLDLHQALSTQGGKKELQQSLLALAQRARTLGESDNLTCIALRWDSLAIPSNATILMDGNATDRTLDIMAKVSFRNADITQLEEGDAET